MTYIVGTFIVEIMKALIWSIISPSPEEGLACFTCHLNTHALADVFIFRAIHTMLSEDLAATDVRYVRRKIFPLSKLHRR